MLIVRAGHSVLVRPEVGVPCPANELTWSPAQVRAARRTRTLIFATVGAVAVAITLVAYAGHVLRSLELKTVDTRFDIRGSQGPPSDLAVVEIDDKTFNDLSAAQWPFSRCYHARVIDQIAKGDPAGDRGRHPVHRAEPDERERRR